MITSSWLMAQDSWLKAHGKERRSGPDRDPGPAGPGPLAHFLAMRHEPRALSHEHGGMGHEPQALSHEPIIIDELKD